jgi:hypothetical protein
VGQLSDFRQAEAIRRTEEGPQATQLTTTTPYTVGLDLTGVTRTERKVVPKTTTSG